MFKKKINPLNDNIFKMYLVKHLYLISVNRVLIEISPDKHYKEVEIPLDRVEAFTREELSTHKITFDHIGVNVAGLSQEDYFNIFPDNNGRPKYLVLTPKGFSAMTGGEFYIKAESRQRDLYQMNFTETANSINFWIMIFAGATVLTAIIGLFKECKKSPERKYQTTEIQYQNQSQSKDTLTLPLQRDQTPHLPKP